jgi:hypothetical protein
MIVDNTTTIKVNIMQTTIPTLMSDIDKLVKPIDIIKYLLRHYVSVPRNINDTFRGQEISFRFDDAELGHDKSQLAAKIHNSFKTVLSKYFPDATSIDVSVSTEDLDDVRYSVVIDILVIIDGTPHSISQNFEVDRDGSLIYNFEGGV